jgi:polysaccharide biosynthesis protein PslH
LLFLTHRIPYPPDKGDKIRSFNLLRYLARRYRVYLGCFVDSVEDMAHLDELSRWCADVFAIRIHPGRSRLRSFVGLLSGEALTLPYYRNVTLRAWVDATVAKQGIVRAVAFSSPMAQYLRHLGHLRSVVDLVDVDSSKWTSYANEHWWPLSAIYRREGERLLAFERDAIARAAAGVLVTHAEAGLFARLAPECSSRMHVIENGVDSAFFAPNESFRSPFKAGETPIVFTGVMDYWPNIDAVTWFARDVLPGIANERPDVRFYIVGMNPRPAVTALSSDPRVAVTGRVPDVRPYLQFAAAVVAPLRIARGVQNKVLEAMSMARPVVVSDTASAGVAARKGLEFEVADSAAEFIARTLDVLDPERGGSMGERARARIRAAYCWDTNLARFADLIEGSITYRADSEHGNLATSVALAG